LNETLLATIERYETNSQTESLADDRTKALDYYLGNPLGNEIDGRSQVVSRDVWDTVEWIKPQIADIFCSGDEVVAFAPVNKEDVQAAEQETQFINHVITQKNEWFPVWYNWSHDALLQKVGYVLAYWDEGERRQKEKYKGLTDDEFTLLLQDKNAVPVEHDLDEFGGHNVTIERVKPYGCVKIVNIAPENVLVSHNSRHLNLQDTSLDFVEYWQHKTLSELRDDGFDVDDELTDAGDTSGDYEDATRDDNNPFRNAEGEESSPATRRVKVRNVWIRFDEDEDGKAELRRVVVVGKTILENEECDLVTLTALCPCPLPHQHAGLSLADAVSDLQLIKTALLRGGLDNQYLANNGRIAVDDSLVNLDDLLVSRPGGMVRVKGPPSQSIFPLAHTSTGAEAVGMMEYVDRVMQKRTGVNEQSQGLDPNSLQNKTLGAAQIYQTAAQQRIKFIARIFAETGVKNLFQVVHALTLKHTRQQEIVRLRNQWVPVDPRLWAARNDMTISVALGSGDKAQQIMFLEGVLQKQVLAAQHGLSDPVKIYNTLKRMTNIAGFKDHEEFWTDPSTQPPKPPQTPPEVLAEQAKGQVQLMVEQGKGQISLQVAEKNAQLKLQEIRGNLELQAMNDERDARREIMRAQMDAELEKQKMALDEWKTQLETTMEKYKTDADNAVKLQIAGLQAQSQTENAVLSLGAQAHESEQQRGADKEARGEEMKARRAETESKKAEQKKPEEAKKALDQVNQAMEKLSKMQKELLDRQDEIVKEAQRPKVPVRDKDGKLIGSRPAKDDELEQFK
jgi:hypothetical protein